ncbi:MAG: hypothetical protein JWO09_880 [Bacteroidetes bacterium]|nr:hypothetical protein [Bacteroidota bacterium]
MKQKDEIIKGLEEEILPRLKEISVLQKEVAVLQTAVETLRGIEKAPEAAVSDIKQDFNLTDYPGYPLNGSIIEKYQYLEDRALKVWNRRDMEALIQKIEGKRHAAKTLKSARQKVSYHIKVHELIRLKYGNKTKYSFFTTRPEWVERIEEEGKVKFRLLAQHEPEPVSLAGLSDDQKKSENICWSGIK